MSVKFKVGDYVKCVCQSNQQQYELDMDKTFCIEKVSLNGIALVGCPRSASGPSFHDESRFVLASPISRTADEENFTPHTGAKHVIPLKVPNKVHAEIGAQVFNQWPTHHMGAAVALNELRHDVEWTTFIGRLRLRYRYR